MWCRERKEKTSAHTQTKDSWNIRSGGAVETCVRVSPPSLPPHVNYRIWAFSRQSHGLPFLHAAISCIWSCLCSVKMPIWKLHHCTYQCFALYQTATHCQCTDCWHRPIAGPTNWNQLQQQAVSLYSWQRYEGLEWASPVQQGPAGEEGWVLHHWSRVTVIDRFREERWWPRFFSCLDSVWKDGHDGRKASKSNCVCTCVCVWKPVPACWRGCAWMSNGQAEH